MNIPDFQQQILSQIGMLDLIKALQAYEMDKAAATQKMVYVLGSGILDSATDAKADILMGQLLTGARIPKQLLDIIRYYTISGKEISKATWDYFYNYRFTGRIETVFNTADYRLAPPAKPLFRLVCENCITDILTKPTNMLIGFIESRAEFWRKLLPYIKQTYYLPKMHSDLLIYIEATVAEYYGTRHPFEVGVRADTPSPFNGYRFVGMINNYPFQDKFMEVCKLLAIEQARSTLT